MIVVSNSSPIMNLAVVRQLQILKQLYGSTGGGRVRAITAQGIHQEFHDPVGAVARRDINVQITLTEVLNQLADTVEVDPKIPPEEKRSLLE